MTDDFCYAGERFADIQMLRYQLKGFQQLSTQQKLYIFFLSEATLWGRDITFDQMGKYNLRIRKLMEVVFVYLKQMQLDKGREYDAFVTYLKQMWFANGIHHHYGGEKFTPGFSRAYLSEMAAAAIDKLCDKEKESWMQSLEELLEVIFNPHIQPKRTNKADGEDLVLTSACNFYEGVSQQEVEQFYASKKQEGDKHPPSWGLNSKLMRRNGVIVEIVWKENGMYGNAIKKIIYWLKKAEEVAENQQQKEVISLLVKYYRTGDLRDFDRYSIRWVESHEGDVDFINGFIEVYDDPLCLKATWEGLVEYKDKEATRRTQTISQQAQWFEDHSPVDPRFRKEVVKGVSANVICAAMLGGEEYPASAIGINLPNADWIRAEHGSKSITIGNLTEAYNKAAHGNGFREEFVIDKETLDLIERYADLTDDLHTDLHECLGHGSGKLLAGTDPDALKAYGNTIEETRADLFGLYFIADAKLVQLGLLPDDEAYKAQYYTYLLNGLMTQLSRIKPGNLIEEAHMRNRALIARWTYEHCDGAMSMEKINGKTYLRINDYPRLRMAFATLLAEVQRIKSEGDFDAARLLVEQYAVNVDSALHQEILQRYNRLNLAPYKGFLNPWLRPVCDSKGDVIDVVADYSETLEQQMMRYSKDYSAF